MALLSPPGYAYDWKAAFAPKQWSFSGLNVFWNNRRFKMLWVLSKLWIWNRKVHKPWNRQWSIVLMPITVFQEAQALFTKNKSSAQPVKSATVFSELTCVLQLPSLLAYQHVKFVFVKMALETSPTALLAHIRHALPSGNNAPLLKKHKTHADFDRAARQST